MTEMPDWSDWADNAKKCYDVGIAALRERLEKSKVVIGDCTLYNEDCSFILPTLHGIGVVVTDPPYGISYKHGARRGGRLMGTDGMAIVGDDQPFDPGPYLQWPCLFWGAEHFKNRLPDGGRWLVWNKRRFGVVRDQGCVENAWCSMPGVTRIFHHVWDGADMKHERGERVHSNQKPVELMKWSLEFFPADLTVFDPFMGSGTTGIACVKMARKFIGIEIDPVHFKSAVRRIEEAYKQPDLFVSSPEVKPEQMTLV